MTDKLPPWFDPQISIGAILQIIAMIVLVVGGYSALRAEQSALANKVLKIEASADAREARLRAMEITQAGAASDVRAIQAGITDIKLMLNELVKRP